ncbi:MAG: 4-amino-4-deoxy-L-arabinose transferase-like glycosyltransferase [Candidatus Nanohaloarchaea archaeon]|jgi:4-amino-4-deoxy-L-arabinose transferase-like glycosyltransferase
MKENLSSRHLRLVLFLILFVALTLRIFPIRTGFHYWDETVYLQHSEIITGESPNNYNEFDIRPPLMSLILGSAQVFTDSFIVFHAIVAFLSTFSVFMLYYLGKEIYSVSVGLLSASAYAVTPVAVTMSNDLLIDSILPLFWILTAFFYVKERKTRAMKYTVLTGVSVGLAVLAKFTSLILCPLLLLLEINRSYNSVGVRNAVQDMLTRKRNWIILGSFLGVMTPYLVWNQIVFGNPVHVFIGGLNATGAVSSFWLYIQNYHLLLPLGFVMLSIAGVFSSELEDIKELKIPAYFALALLIPLQFIFAHKEPRYLLPSIPFICLILGYYSSKIEPKSSSIRRAGYIIAVLIASISILSITSPGDMPDRNSLIQDSWEPPVETAAEWLKQNYSPEDKIYTSFQYPAIAYYSKLDVRKVSTGKNYSSIEFEDGDLIYYSQASPLVHPDLNYLEKNENITLLKEFGGEVMIFQYRESS